MTGATAAECGRGRQARQDNVPKKDKCDSRSVSNQGKQDQSHELAADAGRLRQTVDRRHEELGSDTL